MKLRRGRDDTKVIERHKTVRISELGGGMALLARCSGIEARRRYTRSIEKIAPEEFVVETTGLAEPETARPSNIQEGRCRIAGWTVWSS